MIYIEEFNLSSNFLIECNDRETLNCNVEMLNHREQNILYSECDGDIVIDEILKFDASLISLRSLVIKKDGSFIAQRYNDDIECYFVDHQFLVIDVKKKFEIFKKMAIIEI